MIWDRKTAPIEAVIGIPLPEGGFRLKPYFDGSTHWSIGAGSLVMPNVRPVTARSGAISLAQAQALFTRALAPRISMVADAIPQDLTTGQAAALMSFVYNLGDQLPGSMIQKMVAAGRMDLAIRQFAGWCEEHDAGTHLLTPVLGLMRRRQFEVNLWDGMQPQQAYDEAWKMQLPAGLAAFHQAYADAACWGYTAAPVRLAPLPPPAAASAPAPAPASDDTDTTDALNDASADGSLNLLSEVS